MDAHTTQFSCSVVFEQEELQRVIAYSCIVGIRSDCQELDVLYSSPTSCFIVEDIVDVDADMSSLTLFTVDLV